jgi:hypothetical protein
MALRLQMSRHFTRMFINFCAGLLKYVATWLVVFFLFVARFIKIHKFVSKHTGTLRHVIYFLKNKNLELKFEQFKIN